MKSFLKTFIASAAMSAIGFAASAATIVDFSPETTGAASFFLAGNTDAGQNFGTLINLNDDFTLTSIDRYAQPEFGAIGEDVAVKVWTSDGSTLLHDIETTISVQDSDGAAMSGLLRSGAEFSVDLSAGSYLIGVTGIGNELGQALLEGTISDGITSVFLGDTLFSPQRTASIRVFGDVTAAVPLPAGLPLMIGALAVLGFTFRKRAA